MEIVKIRYEHYRPEYYGPDNYRHSDEAYRYTRNGVNKSFWQPAAKGGRTICKIEILLGDITAYVVGEANCSDKDIFCYATGRQIARFRAMRLISAYKALEKLVEYGPSETS